MKFENNNIRRRLPVYKFLSHISTFELALDFEGIKCAVNKIALAYPYYLILKLIHYSYFQSNHIDTEIEAEMDVTWCQYNLGIYSRSPGSTTISSISFFSSDN